MRAEYAEKTLIGSALMYEECAMKIMELSPEHFAGSEREDFEEIKRAYEKHGHESLVINAEAISGRSYIDKLDNGVKAIDEYMDVVKQMAVRRQVFNIASRLTKDSKEGSEPEVDAMKAVQELSEILNKGTTTREQTNKELLDETLDMIENIQRGEIYGFETGMDIDAVLGRFQKGLFYVIGARPSMGKTAFAVQIAMEVAKMHYVAFLSLETTNRQIGLRQVIQSALVDSDQIRNGQLNDRQMDAIKEKAKELSELKMVVDDTTDITAGGLYSKINYMKKKYDIQMLFVDYLQLMKSHGQSREQEIANVSRVCVNIAKELDICVVGLAQLSRKNEERANKRPMLSDLRESGQLEQDAYAVMFIHRPEYYGITTDENGNSTYGLAEISIAKNKDGQTGIVPMIFDKQFMTFRNMSEDDPSIPF